MTRTEALREEIQKIYAFLVQKKILFFVSLIAFVFITLGKIFNHIHWYDEILPYNISHDLNFLEILKLMKYEGHLFLWYLIIMPFSRLGISSGFTLGFLSFSTVFLSILILWKYSPFGDFEKFLITLASPLIFLSIYSRCYSLSVLFLFALCALYPKRLKHPYWYSILLVLSANTSAVALFGTTLLGLNFLHDVFMAYKDKILSKKNIAIMFSIFIPAGILILYQLLNFETSAKDITWIQGQNLFTNFFVTVFDVGFSIYLISRLSYIVLLFAFSFVCYRKPKILFFFYGSTLALFALFTLVYPPYRWHLAFFFIYLILAFWLLKYEKIDCSKPQKIVSVLFVLCLWLYSIVPVSAPNGEHREFTKYLLDNQTKFENSRVYFFHAASLLQEIMPSVYKTSIKIYDPLGNPITSFEHYKNQAYLPFRALDFDEIFVKNPEIDTYILMDTKVIYVFAQALKDLNRGASLDKEAEIGPTTVFKVIKQKN